jgi:hypothetical protein
LDSFAIKTLNKLNLKHSPALRQQMYGAGESFDGNPFGRPGNDFRKQNKVIEAAKERERLEREAQEEEERRLRELDEMAPPPPMEDKFEEAPVEQCTACCIQ